MSFATAAIQPRHRRRAPARSRAGSGPRLQLTTRSLPLRSLRPRVPTGPDDSLIPRPLGARKRRALPPLFLYLLLLSLLSACAPPPQTTAVASSQPSPTAPAIELSPNATATVSAVPPVTPTASLAAIPPVSPQEPSRGPRQAPVSLLVYSDLDCDLCGRTAGMIAAIRQDHPDQIRYTFRPFPLLGVHEKSAQAAAALFAAQRQERFWEMHDLLYDQRKEWKDLDVAAFRQWLLDQAPTLDLAADQLATDMASEPVLTEVGAAYQEARASGIPGVPFLLINSRPYLADLSRQNLEATVRLAALSSQQYERPPEVPEDLPARPIALLHFDVGDLRLQLYATEAPQAVSSFLFLAEAGWYDETILHRILPGRLVEGGDPTGTGLADAGYHFGLETDPSLRFDRPGMVALANDGPGTNSARYFINLEPMPELNGSYTIFGRVVDGIEHLEGLDRRDPISDLLEPPQVLLRSVSQVEP